MDFQKHTLQFLHSYEGALKIKKELNEPPGEILSI